MERLTLSIKNMVCPRCITVLKNELSKLGAVVIEIGIGRVTVTLPLGITMDIIEQKIKELGFELLQNKEEIIVEHVKISIFNYVENLNVQNEQIVLSEFLAKEVGKNYTYLSKLFSKLEGETIEKFYMKKKISKVKQLLDYGELNLSEIAIELGYSSVHYISSQFKKFTGISVSEYKSSECKAA